MIRITCLVYLVLATTAINCLAQQRPRVDSLREVLSTATDNDIRFECLRELAQEYRKVNIQVSDHYARQALDLVLLVDGKQKAEMLNVLGVNNAIKGDFEVAQRQLLQALEMFDSLRDVEGLAKTNNNLSGVLLHSGDVKKSEEYEAKAIKLWRQLGDSSRVADGDLVYAIIYRQAHDYVKAIQALDRAMVIYQSRNERERMAQLYFNLGHINEDMNRMPDAIDAYRHALAIHHQESRHYLAEVHRDLARAYMKLHEQDSALSNLMKSLQYAHEMTLKEDEAATYETLSELYQTEGNFRIALIYLQRHDSLEHVVFDENKMRQMDELQTIYETNQKDQQLKNNRELIKRQRIIIAASAAAGALLVFLVVVIGYFYREKSKNNKQLVRLAKEVNDKNEEILKQSARLHEVNEEINAINRNLEKMVDERTSRIVEQNRTLREYTHANAHKVRGPLARILGLINVFKQNQVPAEELFSRLEEQAEELDGVVREINSRLQQQDHADD